ncbi:MAG: GNAT family N-acetyltransferase, partial [Gaiellales bacterium]
MVDVILRSGRVTRLREPVRADAEALVAFLSALSDESRYQRFHGALRIVPATVEPYLELDWHDRGALIATVAPTRGHERVAALASFARLRDPRVAEVAFVVADELQGDGIGTRLLEQLAERARAAGIETFVAEVLQTNGPMLRVFAAAGFVSTRTVQGGVVELRFPIASSSAYLARVDERDHLAISRSLRPLLAPGSVAVIGASPRAGSIGGEIFRNIVEGGFRGACHPVNRSGLPVAGSAAYRSVAEIPVAVDLALLCVPAPQVQPAAREALAAGARALCVISSGF